MFTPKPGQASVQPGGPGSLAPNAMGLRTTMCPGSVNVANWGSVALINAKTNKPGAPATNVEVQNGIVPHMKGRTYFGNANSCVDGRYSNEAYANMQLLGKTFSYLVDMSSAKCGCNA